MEKFVLAITRTCGSGGTTIGSMLAKEYQIGLYDSVITSYSIHYTKLYEYTSTAQGFFEKLDKGTLSESMKQTYLNDENLMKYDILKQERLHTGISLYQLSIKKLMEP